MKSETPAQVLRPERVFARATVSVQSLRSQSIDLYVRYATTPSYEPVRLNQTIQYVFRIYILLGVICQLKCLSMKESP